MLEAGDSEGQLVMYAVAKQEASLLVCLFVWIGFTELQKVGRNGHYYLIVTVS